eukprot:GFUD01138904.1.p1 GENE.GFUD01138904.1~~GFUD01138904.1.p1  ORF type:complete len:199 (+),score=41.21 GFUD01138904.1:72-668(+)
MIDTQAMKVPVLLVIVGVTVMLCGQVSTSCSCSGYVTSKGAGECRTFYMGKKYCYVNPGQCSDQIKGSSSNRFWSYQACEKMGQQGQYYNVNEDGYITCQTREDCPPDFDTELDRVSYSCGDTWIEDICSQTLYNEAAESAAFPLTWSSAIGGTGSSSATNPDSYAECGPRYCKRGNKCCLLVYIGYSNRYLGCPQYC